MESIDFSFLNWYPGVSEEDVSILLDGRMPQTMPKTMTGREGINFLVYESRYRTDPAFQRRAKDAMRRVLFAIYRDPKFLHMQSFEIALCLFNDIDIGIFDGMLRDQVYLTRTTHREFRETTGYLGNPFYAITCDAGQLGSRVTIALDRMLECSTHGAGCRSRDCRVKEVLQTLVHEMVHAWLTVHTTYTGMHGEGFLRILGLAQAKLHQLGCDLDLSVDGQYSIIPP